MSNSIENPTSILIDSSGVEKGTSGNPVRTDPTGSTTQPVSATSLPLPTGAATAAKQPALGTAGTASVDVLTVQGITSMTPLKVDGSGVTQPVSGALTDTQLRATPVPVSGSITATNASVSTTGTAVPTSATLSGGSVTTAAPTYTTGQMSALSLTTAGALRVDGSATTQPISGTVTANAGTGNFTVAQATASNLNATVSIAAAQTLATVTTVGAVTAITNALPAGANNIGSIANVAGTVSLPTGASTSALQTTGNTSLATIITNTTGNVVAQGSTTAGQSGHLIQGAVTTAAPTYTTAQTSPLSLTTAGALRVDASGTTQPVSGTVTANQGGTWTVQPGNTANTTAWLVAGGKTNNAAAPGANNFGTLPAVATAAVPTYTTGNQVALSTDLSGQLRVVGSFNNASVSTTGSAPPASATFMGASVTTAAPAYTTGQMSALSLNTAGGLRVDGSGVTQPVSAASLPLPTGASTAANQTTLGSQTTKINDGTNTAAVKAASTAATTTDPALVVAISPNNTVTTAVSDVSSTGALNALNAAVSIVVAGHTGVSFVLSAGTLIGTIIAEMSLDGGTTWIPAQHSDPQNGGATYFNATTLTYASANTAATRVISLAPGASNARVRVSAFTSGTANIALRTSVAAPGVLRIGGAVQDNESTANVNPVLIAGTTGGGFVKALNVNNFGYITTVGAGFAGGPSGGIMTVQGDAAGTPIPVSIAATTTGQQTMALSNPVVIASDQSTIAIEGPVQGDLYNSFFPDPFNGNTATTARIAIDSGGSLQTRGTVLTDEQSFRDDFSGAALTNAVGTLTFTAGSDQVTGTNLLTTIQIGDYIKKTADANTLFLRVDSVDSNTSLTLEANYAGTTATTTAVQSNWQPTIGTGGAQTVGTSNLTIGAGTTANSVTNIFRKGDYGPYTFRANATLSQRIANNTFMLGFGDVASLTPNKTAAFRFTGTVNTSVDCITSFSSAAADTQTTTITLPNGITTATNHEYKIDVGVVQVTFSVDGQVVAQHALHIPGPYDLMGLQAYSQNGAGAPGSNTNLILDNVFFQNVDRLQIDDDFIGEPLRVTAASSVSTLANVASSAASVTLLAANANRNGATIYNDSTQNLFVKFGVTASATSFTTRLTPQAYYEVPFGYRGRIDGIWAAANGAARVTEIV